MKIGIAGYGVVGKAIGNTVSKKYDVVPYDINIEQHKNFDRLLSTELLFISLPTPFDINRGFVVTEHIDALFNRLSESNYGGAVVLKSTSPPGTTRSMNQKYPNLTVIYNPEFLRQKTSDFDFENQTNILIGVGGDNKDYAAAASLLVEILANTVNNYSNEFVSIVSFETAELSKYAQNVFFATRVATVNVIYDACQEFNVEYDDLKEVAFYKEKLIGSNMVEVPGHDGLRGFGGACLPKDLAGFNSFHDNEVTAAIEKYNKSLGRKLEK